MRKSSLSLLLLLILQTNLLLSQSIESLAKELPPYFSILTTWGVRPEWDENSENIYFLEKLIGDVFKINIKTKEITAVTSDFYHGGIYRVLCLKNGDLLLVMGSNKFDADDPEKERHSGLGLYILKKDQKLKPYPLNEYCDEGPAVSKNHLRIAWTLPGQREIKIADIIYKNGIPELVNTKIIISYKDSSAYVRLETQDFRPPNDNELIYTHYWGDKSDQYHHSQVFGFNIETHITSKYTDLKDSYNEAEGIFPDGKYILIESDRHQDLANRNKYKIDIYKLRLDGSGYTERLADFSTRFPNLIRSDNPVVNNKGNLIAHQFGFMKGAGNGKGIFLFDLNQFESQKKSSTKRQNK